jgi:hypothetical protein
MLRISAKAYIELGQAIADPPHLAKYFELVLQSTITTSFYLRVGRPLARLGCHAPPFGKVHPSKAHRAALAKSWCRFIGRGSVSGDADSSEGGR